MQAVATAPHPIYLAGRWVESAERCEVPMPGHPGESAGTTFYASEAHYEEAVEAALASMPALAAMATFERSRALQAIADGITARREEIGAILSREAGKPIRDALAEMDRAALTFHVAAGEAERMNGELIPLDLNPASKGRTGITRRVPIGPVAGISPFNFPLNLAAHKIAPAIAAGCPIVLKPASRTPLTMLAVAEIIDGTGLPKGAVSVLPMTRALGDRLVEDPRFKLLSFTGSPAVGWAMKARAGKKKVVLELGGNAGVIVDKTANLDWAVKRTLVGAFSYAGQICISVQRILVHEEVADAFIERFVAGAKALKLGDALDPTTDLGPMIDAPTAARTQQWVEEAVAQGATLLAGGVADGAWLPPTILANAPKHATICTEEAFAPVVVISRFSRIEEAFEAVNDSAFGLQAGIFTNDLAHGWAAFGALEVGGVILNDIPTYRVDHMPYGGVKDSGLGREGIRYAIEDMTEIRLLVVVQPQ